MHLLRTTAAEMQNEIKQWDQEAPHSLVMQEINALRADLALVAQLLADQIERTNG